MNNLGPRNIFESDMSRSARSMRNAQLSYKEALSFFQQRYIRHVQQLNGNHFGKTAAALGMHRNTLARTLAAVKKILAKAGVAGFDIER